MIWHIDPATHQITILSIPRDTLVSMTGSLAAQVGTYNRINSAFNAGPAQLVQVIQDNFGIPINDTVQVDFAGFEGAVNALGGVKMDFPYPARDAFSGLSSPLPGCQLLNGTEALSVARSRHYEYYADGYWHSDPSSDFGRIQRQDAFLKALISSAKSKVNPLTINAFLGSIPQGVVIDTKLSLTTLVSLGLSFHELQPRRARDAHLADHLGRLRLALGRRALRRSARSPGDAGRHLRLAAQPAPGVATAEHLARVGAATGGDHHDGTGEHHHQCCGQGHGEHAACRHDDDGAPLQPGGLLRELAQTPSSSRPCVRVFQARVAHLMRTGNFTTPCRAASSPRALRSTGSGSAPSAPRACLVDAHQGLEGRDRLRGPRRGACP